MSVRQTAVGRTTATYSCVPGFEIVGNPIRTCGQNGAWLGKPPTCRGKLIYKLITDSLWSSEWAEGYINFIMYTESTHLYVATC